MNRSRLWTISALGAAFLTALPLLTIFVISFLPGEEGTIARLCRTVLPGYLLTTTKLACGVGCGVLLLGVSTAWLVTACDFPGRRVFNHLLIMPMTMPGYLIAFVYIELLDYAGPVQSALRALFGWRSAADYSFPRITSLGGAILLLSFILYPYVFLMARTAFSEQAGRWIEAGRSLNITPRRAFFRLVLPLARPAIISGMLLALMETIGDFGLVQLFAVNTFTVGIYNTWLGASNLPDAARLACGLVIIILLLISIERFSRRKKSYVQPAGAPPPRSPLSGWRGILAAGWCFFPPCAGFLIPLFLELLWCYEGFDQLRSATFVRDAGHSLLLGGITAAVALCCALLLAYGRRLAPTRLLDGAIRLATLGYALPGPVVALGLLIPLALVDRGGIFLGEKIGIDTGYLLSGSLFILVFAFLVRFLTMAYGNVEAGLARISPSCDEAARMLRCGSTTILRRIHLPLLRSSMFTAVLLVVVEVMKELPATLMLQPFNFSTLATRAFSYASEERYQQAALWSVAILLAGVIPVILINLRTAGGREQLRTGG